MSVFSGSSDVDSAYPSAGIRQPKEQICTVVPPTAEGAGSHYDYRGEERADTEVCVIAVQQ